MEFRFCLPVDIRFGENCADQLGALIEEKGYQRGVLVCDGFLTQNGAADRILKAAGGRLVAVFDRVSPNPTVQNVDECAAALRENDADFAVALGGGSTMDCAKAACVIRKSSDSIKKYHTGGGVITGEDAIPLIAIPTTAGTASEVTNVSVLSDHDNGVKAPIAHNAMLPVLALIDYTLTMSVPPRVTASTGLDALSHAIEGFWSVHHQPICDAAAVQAVDLVFRYLPRAYRDGSDKEAREKMMEACLLAGVAFGQPKTTGSHACSYPLTNWYHIPHGEACAFTLDYFTHINADIDNGRLHRLAQYAGFKDAHDMADGIRALKESFGLPLTLTGYGVPEEDIEKLSEASMHPNLKGNPVPMNVEDIEKMYRSLL
ncbi:MAG: iron-containing alcohol dehydrogenase [Clostridia bacterium]|nr:iron-containing alcohol dehydrogenase [Clostridia bacterium]MBQ9989123.1 iron-containing alcohol dehydrogenase [Clostridia bacterium]